MKHLARLVLACAFVVAALAASGCASSNAAAKMQPTGVWGYIAAAKNAWLRVDASSTNGTLVLSQVMAPVDGLVVVTSDSLGSPGMRVGWAAVKAGLNTDVRIPLQGVTTPLAAATLYVDRGTKGQPDINDANPASSPDRPVFVNGREVMASTSLAAEGKKVTPGSAVLDVFDQTEASGTLTVSRVIAPVPSWITVYTDVNGSQGTRLAAVPQAAVESTDVVVPLQDTKYRGRVWVGLQTDAGIPGAFEYVPNGDFVSSPDQPYVMGGKKLIVGITLK